MKEKNIYEYGFDQYLYKQILTVDSPLVYNQIEDRMSQLIPAGQTVTTPLTGLEITEI